MGQGLGFGGEGYACTEIDGKKMQKVQVSKSANEPRKASDDDKL